MMVETILESSQDFGMSSGPLPQWKRELLQRRAARSRPQPAAPPAPPPPPPPMPGHDDDEELRYGPGIVKRLKSRYLSLALREAPRRRPSVLRRATSLEHLLDERPPPAPRPHSRPARPVSLAAPTHIGTPLRRDSVKRARSVDALSRLDAHDDPPPLPPQSPPPPQPQPRPRAFASEQSPPPPPPTPPPPLPRSVRPPRRPMPLLRDAERPPPDLVRSTLRKFESTPGRRGAAGTRVSAVLRGLEAPPRSSTPEPRGRSPSPAAADLSAIDEPEGTCPGVGAGEARRVSRAALEGIARAGCTVRYAFESPACGSHLPPLAAANPVLLQRARLSASPRRVGVIKPMPASAAETASPPPEPASPPPPTRRADTPPPADVMETVKPPRPERKEPPPSALVEPIPRTPPEARELEMIDPRSSRESTPEIHLKAEPQIVPVSTKPTEKKASINGHVGPVGVSGARRLRPAAPAATSVVFNFSDRKEVPDYIENDGIVLRASRRNRFKAGEAGVVALRPGALAGSSESEGEDDEEGARPPSPCSVRFVNDNVLINGRSSLLARTPLHRQRAAKLKLQFDDSLTRTFEYPSETSLCEESPARPEPPASATAPATATAPAPASAPAPAQHVSALAANTHLAGGGGGLARYTPSKTCADTFQLGFSRAHRHTPTDESASPPQGEGALATATATADGAAGAVGPGTDGTEGAAGPGADGAEGAAGPGADGAEGAAGDARPCAAESARSWSESRSHTTDLLF